MKFAKDKFMLLVVGWAVAFLAAGVLMDKFYLLSLALIPIAVYELIRTEGKKNTKPLSLLVLGLLVLQLVHTARWYRFPFDIDFLMDVLPVVMPIGVDRVTFLSVLLLLIFSLLLIKHTWGSVTKFLAILLLLGAMVQAYMFWPVIQAMMNSDKGQQLLEGQQERIKDNLQYRLERELR